MDMGCEPWEGPRSSSEIERDRARSSEIGIGADRGVEVRHGEAFVESEPPGGAARLGRAEEGAAGVCVEQRAVEGLLAGEGGGWGWRGKGCRKGPVEG